MSKKPSKEVLRFVSENQKLSGKISKETAEYVPDLKRIAESPEQFGAQTPRLRTDLVEKLTPEDLLDGVLANSHRYKPEPRLATTGKGYLAPTTPEDRQKDLRRIRKLQRKLSARASEPPRIKVVVRDGLELLTHAQPVTTEDVQRFQSTIDEEEVSGVATD